MSEVNKLPDRRSAAGEESRKTNMYMQEQYWRKGNWKSKVKAGYGSDRFEKIVAMIEDSEKLKSSVESKAEHLADRLVPYTLVGTVLAWLVTRNTMKALAVLMVDFHVH